MMALVATSRGYAAIALRVQCGPPPLSRPRARVSLRPQALLVCVGSMGVAMHQSQRSRPLSRPRARVDLGSQALLVFLGSTSVAMHRSQWLILLSTESRRQCLINDSPRNGARDR